MMNKRNKLATVIVAMALAITSANFTTQVVYAKDESLTTVVSAEATTTKVTDATTTTTKAESTTTTSTTIADETTTTTLPSEVTTEKVEPRAGDKIWINEDLMVFWDVDKSYKAETRSSIKFEMYIIGRYDEDHWRVHVPFMNEPERVLLIPTTYDITVLEHDGRVIGDLTYDGRVDGFDMIMMRRALFRDYDLDNYSDIDALMQRSWDRQLADVNSDKQVSVADLVCMQNFLLGRTKTFRE